MCEILKWVVAALNGTRWYWSKEAMNILGTELLSELLLGAKKFKYTTQHKLLGRGYGAIARAR